MSSPSWPQHHEDEIAAAIAVLRSGRVNYWNGDHGRAFEREFAAACNRRYGIALANGTIALELALRALNIGEGDEVVVTPRSFVASASCVVNVGAIPVFADVDQDSQNVTAETINAVLTPKTRAIIPVHLAGWPCEMDDIMQLAEHQGLKVIEDCAQAHGATYRGRPVGSLGHVAAFSFCTDKIITTAGEGGMIVTDDPELSERIWSLKDHGKLPITRESTSSTREFKWVHETFGGNARLTELQSAIGRVQLARLSEYLTTRRRNAAILSDHFSHDPMLRITTPPADVAHAYYKYYVFLGDGFSERQRNALLASASERGMRVFSGSCPEIYRENAFSQRKLVPPARLPTAAKLGETSLMFEVHPTLTAEHMETTAVEFLSILRTSTKSKAGLP